MYQFSVVVTISFVMKMFFFYYICIFKELLDYVAQEAA